MKATVAIAVTVLLANWWTQSFPPPSIRVAQEPLPAFKRANVIDGAAGYLDAANAVPEGGVLLIGWAFDPRSNLAAKRVLVLDNGRTFPRLVHVYRERADVAAPLKNRALLHSGWVLWIPGDEIAPGKHELEVYAVFDDGKFGLVGRSAVTVPPR